MDQDDPNVEGPEDRDIEEDIGEIFVGHDGGVDAEDEAAFPKSGDVTEDAAEVGWFHDVVVGGRRWGRERI